MKEIEDRPEPARMRGGRAATSGSERSAAGEPALPAKWRWGYCQFIEQGPWFAWRPVRLEAGGWAWLKTVRRDCWWVRLGDYGFEDRTYALLP